MKGFIGIAKALVCCAVVMAVITSCSKKNGSEEAEAAYESEIAELHCKGGDIDIYGLMYMPKGKEGKLPVVILSHSSSLTHAAMVPYAEYLSEKGYAAYCFDFCGSSDKSQSKGRTTDEMTVFTEVEDLEIVLDKISSLDYIDQSRVYVLGSSQGGLVTALVAEKHQDDIKGMILFYPAFNMPEIIAKFTSSSGLGGILGSIGGGNMGMSDAFVESIKDFDVYANIGAFSRPVKIIHGSNDIIVNVSYSEQAVAVYPNATLDIIQGANHGFNADNLGGFGGMGGASADYDSEVIPIVLEYMSTNAPL